MKTLKALPHLLFTCLISLTLLSAEEPRSRGTHEWRFVERVSFDWNHSGTPSTFTLSHSNPDGGASDTSRLIIRRQGLRPWLSINSYDTWGLLKEEFTPHLISKNLTQSPHMLFVSSGPEPNAHIFLILHGAGSGCCVGSLAVLTPDANGNPKLVFRAETHLIEEINPLPGGDGIELIGQPSDAEARTARNATSYDPFRVYTFSGDNLAHYDLEKSKAYTIKHYCQWAGPNYNEKWVAVTIRSGQPNAENCHVMKEHQFTEYVAKHPSQFSD